MLGVQLAAGPGLTAADEHRGSARVTVISDSLWRSIFNADPGVVGRSVALNGETFTVVGVTPRGFEGIVRGQRADLWASVSQFFPIRNRPDALEVRAYGWMNLVGRLGDGVSAAQAQDQLTAVVRQVDQGTVGDNYGVRLHAADAGDQSLVGRLDTPLNMLMATVGLILLIACANVANLLLARAYGRQVELALRQALGATRGRIVRQLLSETLVLSAVAGSVGLLLAFWVVDLFELRTADAASALALSVGPRWQVVMFAMLASLVAALGSGVLPAIGTSRTDLIEIMKLSSAGFDGTPRRRHLRSALAVIQIALSLVLIVGAGLFLRSLWRLRSIEPSLSTDRVIAATLNLTLRGYDQPRGHQFYEALLARVVVEPGIEAATIASVLPVTAGGSRINVNARSTDPPLDGPFEADMISIGPGYFDTLGVPLVAGRDFASADAAGAPRVTVVNETMKQRVWGQSDPVGRTFAFVSGETFIVVGVARDTKYRNLREARRNTMYLPLTQSYSPAANLVVRTALPTTETVRALRRHVAAVDSAMPLYNVRTMAEHLERSLYLDDLRARLVGSLALLAVTLAAVGIYGLVSFSVAARRREIGLRLALGASTVEVVRLVLVWGSRIALMGVALGLVLSLWLARVVAGQLDGITARDPLTFVAGSLFLLIVAVAATLVPALRGTRVDPITTLREGALNA